MKEKPKTENRNPKSAILYPPSSIRHLWSWPLAVPVMLGIFSVWVVLMLFTVSCATDKASLDRYQAEYKAATNTVAVIHTAVQPYIPAPASAASETVFALVTGLLAAWNTWQHRQISQLKNGNGNGTGQKNGAGTERGAAAPAASGP